MKVEYSKRAIVDLKNIVAYYRKSEDPRVAEAIAQRIREVVARISQFPESAPRVVERPDIRVVLALRYPYKIFYWVGADAVRIVHIRHMARRPWVIQKN